MNQVFPVPSATRVLLPGFEIDLAREELRARSGDHVELRPRSFAVLRLLATNLGRLVTKDEIMQKVWDDAVVTEDSLTQCIADIRRAIGDDGRKIVRTVPRRGYLLVPEEAVETEIAGFSGVGNVTGQRPSEIEVKGTDRRQPRGLWLAGGVVLLLLLLGAGLALYQFTLGSFAPQIPGNVTKGPSVAVVPFENLTGDSAQDAFADAVTRELITALGRFKELSVLSRNMTAAYRGKSISPAELARILHVGYIVEGSVRPGSDKVRVSVQLQDSGGVQVWTQTYEDMAAASDTRPFPDQIASRASAALGTWTGAIAANEIKKSQGKAAAELTAYECIAQGYLGAAQLATGEPFRRARECLRVTLTREPKNAAAWASLSTVLATQRWWGVGLDPPESVDLDKRAYLAQQAIEAAQRAVDLSPNDSFTRLQAARAHYAGCNRDLLRVEAERTLALNANDPVAMGTLGNWLGNSGFWEIGTPLAEKAVALTSPTTPRWWWWVIAKDRWLRSDYPGALTAFQKSYAEQLWMSHLQMAYTLPHLGRTDEANAHVETLLRLKPGFTIAMADAYYTMWCFEAAYREKMRAALRLTKLPE